MLRAALTISRKSPEKIKLGFKQIIRPLVKYGHVLAPAQRSALRLAANKLTRTSGIDGTAPVRERGSNPYNSLGAR
jgi:hypothetical protein